MSSTVVEINHRAKVISASIELYILSRPKTVRLDKWGYEHYRLYKLSDLARELGVSWKTLYRWRITGNISPVYAKELIRRRILKKEDLI